jgi:hypothetical protein
VIDREQSAAWARYVDMIPEELSAAGWTLWSFCSGTTLFGDPAHRAVLHKDLDDPDGARAAGDGSTREEAVRGAIREALDIEAANQAQTPQA